MCRQLLKVHSLCKQSTLLSIIRAVESTLRAQGPAYLLRCVHACASQLFMLLLFTHPSMPSKCRPWHRWGILTIFIQSLWTVRKAYLSRCYSYMHMPTGFARCWGFLGSSTLCAWFNSQVQGGEPLLSDGGRHQEPCAPRHMVP